MTETAPLLSVEDLTVAYSRRGDFAVPAVDDVSFAVRAGSMTAVVGASGAGKATTANAVIGLLPESAQIT
ncbi:MAG: ATP-binding cassette domain-containing protein, partial [Brevibacterium sp.]|nr:ATP-binding cassette domain-containing protein [Brevibacterium sp.]